VIDEEPAKAVDATDPAEVPASASDPAAVPASASDVAEAPADTDTDLAEVPADTDPATDFGQPLATATELGQAWRDIQAAFVDDPRGAVGMAAEATDTAMNGLIDRLRSRRDTLSAGLAEASDHRDTEELRGELRRYRTLCQNLAEIEQRLASPQPASA
jgi:hypothetical protein